MKHSGYVLVASLAAVMAVALMSDASETSAAEITIHLDQPLQTIDGFGTCLGGGASGPAMQRTYFDDLGCSILRIDITPRFGLPYSFLNYYSPWFMGSQTESPFNIEYGGGKTGGPENNGVRAYTGPGDYSRPFGGKQAPIAVMGPDIEKNIHFFDYTGAVDLGAMAKAGQQRDPENFKLYGSIWSPAPWLKVSSGNAVHGGGWPSPQNGAAFPFIWAGNFAGGKLDVSGQPLDVFNDGTGPTSALTQFARCTAAYLKGFQDLFHVHFYAISIQNELDFEEIYGSCIYPRSQEYIVALEAVRAELDKYPDLKSIQIAGPEDVLGGDAYGMWELGQGDSARHKNLQFIVNVESDPAAVNALAFFAVHGYASDGVTSAGSDSRQWDWWANGWNRSPAPGLPGSVKGFTAYSRKSWMTETSGEKNRWLFPDIGPSGNVFPDQGAWGLAFKTQQALTAGRESAIIYWQFAGADRNTTDESLTQWDDPEDQPKFVAARHFFRYIRPGAVAVQCDSTGGGVTASAYWMAKQNQLTIVLVNRDNAARQANLALPAGFEQANFQTFTSDADALWKPGTARGVAGRLSEQVPPYGVMTLVAQAPKN